MEVPAKVPTRGLAWARPPAVPDWKEPDWRAAVWQRPGLGALEPAVLHRSDLAHRVCASPVAACNEIESVELPVTDPENVEPSFKVTVACCWVACAAPCLAASPQGRERYDHRNHYLQAHGMILQGEAYRTNCSAILRHTSESRPAGVRIPRVRRFPSLHNLPRSLPRAGGEMGRRHYRARRRAGVAESAAAHPARAVRHGASCRCLELLPEAD